MSQLIATINGVKVYSDKQMSGISNSRITFNDGSWCDVSTGQVANKGQGYISIGAPSQEDGSGERVTVGPKLYQASALDVQGISADVDVRVSQNQEIVVTLCGPKSEVDNIDIREERGTLVLGNKNANTKERGNNVVISGGGAFIGGGISIGGIRGGRTIINMSGGESSETKVTVDLPKGTAVNVAGVQGKVNIGDTEGVLRASVLGGNDVTAGSVRDVTLSVQGSGDISVASVNGALSASVQGSGDVRVKRGSVTMLNANVMGSGDVRFDGEAVDAVLSVMGSGDIDVAHVKNRPTKNSVGSGDITVGNW